MKDVIQWLYYIRLSKYSRGHEDTIIEVHSKWVNDRLRWIKDHRGASNIKKY